MSEATGANIFFNIGGELHTPVPDCFLDGITRRTVIALAQKHQIRVVERPILPNEMASATEVFLTGTAAEVTPVRQIGMTHYNPGPMTELLVREYDALVRTAPADARLAA